MTPAESVFINCPFDAEYQRLLRAVVFAVHDCGFIARSSLERDDGSEVRIDKIRRIIGESQFGVHDISRTEVAPASGLPRFNMPLELGMFLGAKYFGGADHSGKACVIFDRERYRYQVFCSDLAGQDVRGHGDAEREVIRGVRDAARTWVPERVLPGGDAIFRRYCRFVQSLPRLARRVSLHPDELTFGDLSYLVVEWLGTDRPSAAA
ncbi:MAG TPA: hypothetical protein VJT67_12605 [Longimicrobiaceae bacterium]|nr:hypothetical protein [Longimicrobiaceae bacterium]